MRGWAAALVLFVAGGAAPPAGPSAVFVEGPRAPAELNSVEAGGRVTFVTEGRERAVPLPDLVRWGQPLEPRRGARVLLADDGLLAGEILLADRERLKLASPSLGEIDLPWSRVAGVLFAPPADASRADLLEHRVRAAAPASDQLWLANGDTLPGRLQALDAVALHWESRVGPGKFDPAGVLALVCDPALVERADARKPRTWVGLRDGSRVLVERLAVAAGAGERPAELSLGAKLVWQTSAGEICWLQPLGGRATYLSDLAPARYRHLPFLSLPWEFQRDRSALVTRLRVGRQLYAKGLGLYTTSVLTYELDGEQQRFEAELALDDQAGIQGSAVVRVYVDKERKYESETLRGGAPPVAMSVDVRGARRLDVIVEFADRGSESDYVDLLDARLVR